MPRQVKAQSVGRQGERWFTALLPSTWILQPPLDDVGVDGVVVICEDGPLNGLEFRVQIKSSDKWTIRDESILVRNVNRDSALYWITGFTPTLLVLYEVSTGRGAFAWANQVLAGHQRLVSKAGKTVSLHVPLSRELKQEVWPQIGQELRALNGMLARRLLSSGKAVPLLRAVHALAEAIHGFDFAANCTKDGQPVVGDDAKLLWQLEVSCHRDVVRALRSISAELDGTGVKIEGLSAFTAEYASKCSGFIGRFDEIVADPDKLRNLQVNVAEMATRRAGFTRSLVDAIRQLTAIGLQVVPKPDPEEGSTHATAG